MHEGIADEKKNKQPLNQSKTLAVFCYIQVERKVMWEAKLIA